ncbi:MAG: hypothetical protein GY701_05785 [Sulfitobacter sp.]|nr:hypothetical protein [Sulfitobacter sp.]
MNLNGGVLAEFGNSLGLGALSWPDSGAMAIEFESRGTLFLEERGEDLLVYLTRELDAPDCMAEILRNALRLCHYREGLPYTVHTGLRGESGISFLVRVDAYAVTLPELERILEILTVLHDKAVGSS